VALYAFAKPADGSYLGQFTGATSVFINEIPSTLTGLSTFDFANIQLVLPIQMPPSCPIPI
jgi:hypothetical protein